MNQIVDVLIVGGGPAGLSAALTLARGGRTVLVCDDGNPRNAPASHMQNFPSRDGTPPSEFRDLVKLDLAKYKNVNLLNVGVQSITRVCDIFDFILNDQRKLSARKIMLAHGVKDFLPDLPGAQEIFGKALFFCPYCHGYEHRDSPMALIANGEFVMHMATTISGLTKDLKIFTNGPTQLTPDQHQILKNNNIEVIEHELAAFIHEGEYLKAIKLKNNESIPRSFAFTIANFKNRSDLGEKLGCQLNEMGLYKVDETGKTSEKGIFAAGDIISMRHSVLLACASGQLAAATMNYEILNENFMSSNTVHDA